MYYIYCDESCHLQKDREKVMLLGAMICPSEVKDEINNDMRKLKEKYGLSSYYEVKWTKVSMSKINLYKEMIDYYFNRDGLFFRCLIATGKNGLDHDKYNEGSSDKWYYKMYYYLLHPMIGDDDEYRIFLDIKDTRGGEKVKELHKVLCNSRYDFYEEVIKDIKQVNSNESELLQLVDLLIGAIGFVNRDRHNALGSSEAKNKIVDYLVEKSGKSLKYTSALYERKMNLFVWTPRRK